MTVDCCHTTIKTEERIGMGGMFNEVKGDNKINNENMYDEEKKVLYCAMNMLLIDMPMRILVYYGNSDVTDVLCFDTKENEH